MCVAHSLLPAGSRSLAMQKDRHATRASYCIIISSSSCAAADAANQGKKHFTSRAEAESLTDGGTRCRRSRSIALSLSRSAAQVLQTSKPSGRRRRRSSSATVAWQILTRGYPSDTTSQPPTFTNAPLICHSNKTLNRRTCGCRTCRHLSRTGEN